MKFFLTEANESICSFSNTCRTNFIEIFFEKSDKECPVQKSSCHAPLSSGKPMLAEKFLLSEVFASITQQPSPQFQCLY